METDLNEIVVFVKVVESGSFSQAARQLGMPNSTVSSKVSSLEARLGLTLIQRTTRRLSITPAGQAFYKKCAAGLSEILRAQDEVSREQTEPQGLLRITAPIDLGKCLLPEVISAFLKKYKKVQLEMLLEERMVDLVAEGVDLAIRVGKLEDSSLIAKKLGSIYFAAMASPQYLKMAGMPKAPKDLKEHACVQFTSLGREGWTLTSGKSTVTVPMNGQLMSNDLNIVKSLTLAGNGVALLPTFLCAKEFHEGRLQRIFPDWNANARAVHFVYPAQKYVHPKVSVFMEFATEPLKKILQSYEL